TMGPKHSVYVKINAAECLFLRQEGWRITPKIGIDFREDHAQNKVLQRPLRVQTDARRCRLEAAFATRESTC
ncbi:hypothetical protein, partial [Mesorhizobium sanjuanii]|uniref:hypothetical protein n=1 Tax=Mesorhizobium sanjuanii TaxID=2037900 RepID=UPI001AD7FDF6